MKHKLIPHKYQKPALITFLISLVLMFGSACLNNSSATCAGFFEHTAVQVVIIVLMYASLLVTIFSSEKIEDEMITAMRLHSAAFAFLVGFFIIAVLNIIQAVLPGDAYIALREWRTALFWNGNAVLYFILLYFIVFKIKVWKLERRMRDEE